MVRTATTVAGVTSRRKIEYTPTDKMMSWTTDTTAPTAMRHSSCHEMYSASTMKNQMSAVRALLVT